MLVDTADVDGDSGVVVDMGGETEVVVVGGDVGVVGSTVVVGTAVVAVVGAAVVVGVATVAVATTGEIGAPGGARVTMPLGTLLFG